MVQVHNGIKDNEKTDILTKSHIKTLLEKRARKKPRENVG